MTNVFRTCPTTGLKVHGPAENLIKANAVAPIAATRMTEDIMPKKVLEKLTPEFVAPVVAYLCTEECPDNSSVFVVGGGRAASVAKTAACSGAIPRW